MPRFSNNNYILKLKIFQKKRSMKLLILIALVTILAECALFGQIPIDPNLKRSARRAINELLETLDDYVDCDIDDQPMSSKGKGSHRYNQVGNFAIRRQCHFKQNDDNEHLIYTQPLAGKMLKTQDSCEKKSSQENDLYKNLVKVAHQLGKIKQALIRYNNVVIGNRNQIIGVGNIVIGDNNKARGNNFWIFDSNVNKNGIKDGVLIIKNYLIEMADLQLAKTNPIQLVKCVNPEVKYKKSQKWEKQTEQHLKCFI